MSRLKELAVNLLTLANSGADIHHFEREDCRETAAILLAASKADVGHLMTLVAERNKASYEAFSAESKQEKDAAILRLGKADIALETALRMAIAEAL